MRVLMLNNEFPPLGGGTATVTYEVLMRLARYSDLEIDLITSSTTGRDEETAFSSNFRLHRLNVGSKCLHHSSNVELLRYAYRSFHAALALARQTPFSVCLAWSAVPAGAVALALERKLEVPFVVRVGGPDIPGFEARYWYLYPAISPLIKLVWRHSQAVIAKCDSEGDLIRACARHITPVIIPNGVDVSRFGRAKRDTHHGPLRLLCVGRLIARKGQRILLEACRRLKEQGTPVVVTLVGTGDSEDEYRRLAKQWGISDSVEFKGYVPREELPAHYATADVFVLPSENEGMSIATLEALAAGLPLLLTPTPGTELMVEEGGNGHLFPIGDATVLTERIRTLIAEPERLRRYSARSRELAQTFSWEQATEALLELLQCAASQSVKANKAQSRFPG
ncbi:MAG: glycosyltransferase family 4 protein [Bdellovibrionales bacterium]|nr:glycosyltransferase family 4 protein [Bdellovibrionales bacterium]